MLCLTIVSIIWDYTLCINVLDSMYHCNKKFVMFVKDVVLFLFQLSTPPPFITPLQPTRWIECGPFHENPLAHPLSINKKINLSKGISSKCKQGLEWPKRTLNLDEKWENVIEMWFKRWQLMLLKFKNVWQY